jgi:glucose/arabinose dehydrogenase
LRLLAIDGAGREDVDARGQGGHSEQLEPRLAGGTPAREGLGQADRLHAATLRLSMRRQVHRSRFALRGLVAIAVVVGGCGVNDSTPRTTTSPTPAASNPAPTTTSGRGSASPARAGHPDLHGVHVALSPVAAGLESPVWVTGDGSGRLFVVEQPGRIRIVADGSAQDPPFLDITDRITAGGERGLLGLAFPAGFGTSNPRFYVYYSAAGNGDQVLSEFQLAQGAVDQADPASERVLLQEPDPYPNHNGGWIGFDGEGMLLLALGDGGSGGDPENRASDLGSPQGKILRIDPTTTSDGRQYGIPADNPFVHHDGARPEVLHYGLRNPFRDSFDAGSGDLWIGDVGQNAWEEVDVARAGARGLDFGWRRWEGFHCFNPSTGCDPAGVTQPIAEYDHGQGCAVIGGVVYRGSAPTALKGAYLFSDNCSGLLFAIDASLDSRQTPYAILATKLNVSAVSTGDDAEVYLTELGGQVLKLVPGS